MNEWPGIKGMTFAAILCLFPGWLVFTLQGLYKTAKSQAIGFLAGAGIRLVMTAAGVLWVKFNRPDINWELFLVWIVLFYLACLAVETGLIVQQLSHTAEPDSRERNSVGSTED
ncbi:hypothetical protein [Calycomorphotria hydatis]|nr:hypothetical protein [Calycomorphotria hydatis]